MARAGVRVRAAPLLLVTAACGGCSTSFPIQPADLVRAREGTVRTPERQTVGMPARWSAEVHLREDDDARWMIPPTVGTPLRPVLVPDGRVRAARRARWTDKPLEVGQGNRVGASTHLGASVVPLPGLPPRLEPGIWFEDGQGRRVELPLRAVERVEVVDLDAVERRRATGIGAGIFAGLIGVGLIVACSVVLSDWKWEH
jgi:hypothetical protein